MSTPHALITALLEELRAAASDGALALRVALGRSTSRIGTDPEYARQLRGEVRSLLSATTSTHLLTELGILSDEPLGTGIVRRIGSRVAPAPARARWLESSLGALVGPGDAPVFAAIEVEDLGAWVAALIEGQTDWEVRRPFASAMVILATRVAGAGVEVRLSERLPQLEAWNSPFVELSRVIDSFAEAWVGAGDLETDPRGALEAIARCVAEVCRFREQKEELGTTLHLSSASLRMLQQLERLRLLVECTCTQYRARAIAALGLGVLEEVCRRGPIRHFVRQKLDLLAYLVVGHAAQKGEAYAVRSSREYWSFWARSLLGGTIVAFFALAKLHLSHESLAPVPQALVYGLNYAVCFVLIYVFGATLATKQPAFTASRIADALEEGADYESFPELVRAIWRSQFVSFLGNILGAATVAVAIALVFASATGQPLVDPDEALLLADKAHPLRSGAVWYAAIAGVMLSVAGFFAGFVDNAVVFHRVADRVMAGGGVFRALPDRIRAPLAARIEKSTGGLAGNVLLGFLLGSAGTIGMMLGLPFDIRHIAFASSHCALALLYAPGLHTASAALVVVASVCVIGLVNFVVSFGVTLAVAIDARRLDGIDWRSGLRGVVRLAKSDPVGFLMPVRRGA